MRGGKRPGSGRKPSPTTMIHCSIPIRALEVLKTREALTGTYRTRIAAEILTDVLIGGTVSR